MIYSFIMEKTAALSGVSVSAPGGQVTAVVGGDGAGKSTLLRCLAGAQAPGTGTVRRPAKERIGYLPAGSGVYPDLTVTENLDFRATVLQAGAARRRGSGPPSTSSAPGSRRRPGGWPGSCPAGCGRNSA